VRPRARPRPCRPGRGASCGTRPEPTFSPSARSGRAAPSENGSATRKYTGRPSHTPNSTRLPVPPTSSIPHQSSAYTGGRRCADPRRNRPASSFAAESSSFSQWARHSSRVLGSVARGSRAGTAWYSISRPSRSRRTHAIPGVASGGSVGVTRLAGAWKTGLHRYQKYTSGERSSGPGCHAEGLRRDASLTRSRSHSKPAFSDIGSPSSNERASSAACPRSQFASLAGGSWRKAIVRSARAALASSPTSAAPNSASATGGRSTPVPPCSRVLAGVSGGSASRTSRAVAGRLRGSASRHHRMAQSNSGSSPGIRSEGRAGGVRCRWRSSAGRAAANGRRPVISS
jgi:hypothetical protein